jgi:hypothetical protein
LYPEPVSGAPQATPEGPDNPFDATVVTVVPDNSLIALLPLSAI